MKPVLLDPAECLGIVADTLIAAPSRRTAAIEAILLLPGKHSDALSIEPDINFERDTACILRSDAAVTVYLREFGLLETLECIATSPDLLGFSWEDAEEKFVMVAKIIMADRFEER